MEQAWFQMFAGFDIYRQYCITFEILDTILTHECRPMSKPIWPIFATNIDNIDIKTSD